MITLVEDRESPEIEALEMLRERYRSELQEADLTLKIANARLYAVNEALDAARRASRKAVAK